MNIDDGKKSRAALKSYFVKNAIPTEQQFAQLMDSVLNQRDDGLVKVAGDPLAIEAVGDVTSFKKALNFYTQLSDNDPAWTVSLRPRNNPADPQTGRAGLSINDAAGNSRLAIDAANGRVGIGVIAPAEALDVAGRIKAGPLAIGPWPANPGPFAFVGASTLDQTQAGNYALLQELTGAGAGRTYVNSPLDIRFRIKNADCMVLASSGNNVGHLGIGVSPSKARLEVNGMVGNTVALFGGDQQGISLVASWPTVGINCYFSGGWKAIQPGWCGMIDVNQDSGGMQFYVNPARANAADAALTPQNRFAVHADGKLFSPMWKATHVLNQRQGPMPVSGTFVSGGGTLVIIFSGSGFATIGTNIGLALQIDGGTVATTRAFTNEPSSHKAFTTNILVQGNVAAGNHTINLIPLVNTLSDGNDWYNVTVLELPF